MSTVINDEVIEYIGILSKLDLTAKEAERAKRDISDMLSYIDKLKELDTDGIEPLSHTFKVQNVFRDDIVTNGDLRDEILKNAPSSAEGMFAVPKTVES